MVSIGKRFKELRREKKMTQGELLADFNKKYFRNYRATAISYYENNKRVPEISALKDFADYFGVSVSYLLGESNVRNPEKLDDVKVSAGNNSGTVNTVVNSTQQNVNIQSKNREFLSDEDIELVRVYKSLDLRRRNQILNQLFALEEEMKKQAGNENN